MMCFVLFNFNDTPKEAHYRMQEVNKLGIRPYPQQYVPLNNTDKKVKYIGKHWSKNLLRCFRYFWLMAGCYQKKSFEEFVRTDPTYNLTDDDWKLWEA